MAASNLTKSILRTLLVTIIGLTMNFSQAEEPQQSSEILNPFIYEVSHPDAPEPSYLFGSWHYGISTAELPHWVNRLHNNARVDIYEMDVSSIKSYKLKQNLCAHPVYVLSMGFPFNDDSTKEKLKQIGISDSIAPFFPITSCGWTAYLKVYALDQIWRSLDHEFMINTKLNGKLFVELESYEIRELAEKQLPPEEQDEPCQFSEMLEDLDTARMYLDLVDKELKRSVNEYRAGENWPYPTEDDEFDMIFRNNHWLETLIPEIKSGNSFAVVGVNHLFGNEGLISLLEKRGYTVKRLSEDPRPTEEWIRWRR